MEGEELWLYLYQRILGGQMVFGRVRDKEIKVVNSETMHLMATSTFTGMEVAKTMGCSRCQLRQVARKSVWVVDSAQLTFIKVYHVQPCL